MNSIDYNILIHKKLTEQISTEESFQLENWLKTSDENRALYEQTSELWNLSQQYTPSFSPNVSRAIKEQIGRIREDSKLEEVEPKIIRMKPVTWALRIAAVLVLLLATIFVFKPTSTAFSSGDSILYTTLEDGSGVWLNENSSLELSSDFGKQNRSVKINGEAFFQVKRMENLPFVVDAGNLKVEVLGTSYTVSNYPGQSVSVAVKSGKVKVSTTDNSQVIENSEKLILTNDHLLDADVAVGEFSWTNPTLSFKNAPLAAVFSDLENHFSIDIAYNGNTDLEACRFTNKSMKDSSIDEIFTILELTYEMTVERIEEKSYKVSRIRCK